MTGARRRLALVPQPRQVTRRQGEVALTGVPVAVATGQQEDHFAAGLLRDALRTFAASRARLRAVDTTATVAGTAVIIGPPTFGPVADRLIGGDRDALRSLPEGGYLLRVDSGGAVICATSARGRYYGVQTLVQLLRQAAAEDRPGVVPFVGVVDWPDLDVRCYMDDVARGQVSTVDDFERIITRLGGLKVSHYMLYLEDMFEFRSHPAIGRGRGRLSKTDVARLVRHAQRHHVELVPVIQTLGHMERILRLPKYASLRERPDDEAQLSPAAPGAYELLDDLIAEVAEAFPSEHLVLGADEALGLGKGQSAAAAERVGIVNLWLAHVERVTAMARKRGKTTIVAVDMFDDAYYRAIWDMPAPFPPDDVGLLPRDVTPAAGTFLPVDDHAVLHVLAERGFRPLAIGGLANWTRLFPRLAVARQNLSGLANAARTSGGAGIVGSSFCDMGGDNLRELVWYGVAWLADTAWGPARPVARFEEAFLTQFYGLADPADQADAAEAYAELGRLDDHFPPPWESNSVVRHLRIHAWPWLHAQSLGGPSGPLALTTAQRARLWAGRERLERALPALERARKSARWNDDHFDYLEHAARMALHVSDRLLCAEVDWHERAPALRAELQGLRDRFAELWLRTNRGEGLDANLARLDAVAAGYA